jgi:hypothetical protein
MFHNPTLKKLVVDLKTKPWRWCVSYRKSREGGVARSLVLRLSVAADPQGR